MTSQHKNLDDLRKAFSEVGSEDQIDHLSAQSETDDLAASFAQFATPITRAASWRKDAKEEAKLVAQAGIEAVDRGETKGRMFRPDGKGGFIVTFRNGVKVMEVVKGQKDWGVDDKEKLKALLRHFIRMCDLGELDQIFAAQAK